MFYLAIYFKNYQDFCKIYSNISIIIVALRSIKKKKLLLFFFLFCALSYTHIIKIEKKNNLHFD